MPRRFCRKRRKEARRDFSWRRARGSARTPPEAARRSPRAFTPEAAAEKYGEYLRPVLRAAERAYCIAEHVAPLLSDTKHPQGIFCVCRMPDRAAGSGAGGAGARARARKRAGPVQHGDDPAHRRSARRAAYRAGRRLLRPVTARRCCAAAWARCFGSAWSGTRRRPRAPKRSAGAGSRRWRLCRTRRPCPSRRSRLTRAGGPSGSATRETA